MKNLKKIISAIAWILILGGTLAFFIVFLNNRVTLGMILSNPAVQASIIIFIKMLCCIGAVILGFVFLTLSLKMGLSIRAKEREKKKLEVQEKKEAEKTAEDGAEDLQ